MSRIYGTARINCGKLAVGNDTRIGDFVLINLRKLLLDDGSQINSGARLVGGGDVEIGKYSVIGYNVVILTRSDTPEGEYLADAMPEEKRAIKTGSVKIGNNCFIGSNSVIMPNVVIEDNAVIGALSYISHDSTITQNTILLPKQQFRQYIRKSFKPTL